MVAALAGAKCLTVPENYLFLTPHSIFVLNFVNVGQMCQKSNIGKLGGGPLTS